MFTTKKKSYLILASKENSLGAFWLIMRCINTSILLFFPVLFFAQIQEPTGVMGFEKVTKNHVMKAATGSTGSIGCDNPINSFCDGTNSALIMNTATNKEFIFDSFSKYNGGITLNGSTILKVKVANNTSNPGDCQWKLQMIVSNGGFTQTPDENEWETLQSYSLGSQLTKPTLDILQIRVDNACHTPQNYGQLVFPFTQHDDVVDIINPTAVAGIPPGPGSACSGNETNEEGTYLGLDYGEYSFIIDYRVDPGFNYIPGRYEISIKFCLTER